jgi:DNA-binding transcriptional regulator LsrR (DeoR family)
LAVDLSPDERELLARIAHRWYLDDRTQTEIAHEFGLSRPKVQRLLVRARQTGVVQIRIDTPFGVDLGLEARLIEAFGLTDAIVSPSDANPETQRAAVARAAAGYLERRLTDGTIVAVSHGRDIGAIPRQYRPSAPVNAVFASAMGGSPTIDSPTNPNEIGRALAERAGGRAESLFAPAYVESADVRDSLHAQEAIAHVLRTAAAADLALVGIGGTDDNCTMVRSGCLDVAAIGRLREQGAVGDVLGNYVDVRGELIASPHSSRLVGLSMEDLRRIANVVAVVSGSEKPRAILGVLRAGIVDVLIVDETNARTVLDLMKEGMT